MRLIMQKSLASTLGAMFLAGGLAASACLWAAEDQVTLNFVNAEIEAVVKAISQITGRNFLIDPRVKGTINIVSGKAIPQSQAYTMLLSALRMQGFAAVESDGVVKIIPEAEAKTLAGPVVMGAGGPTGDQVVTKVFVLRHESAAQLLPVLRPLIAPGNSINANPGNNTLVVSDYAANLERISKVLGFLDAPFDEEPKLVPLQHASAIDVANTISRMYGEAAGDVRKRVIAVADSRSNSIVLQADSPSRMARVLSMIMSLDQPTATAGNIHVIYLKNADAARMAQTLRSIVSGEAAPIGTSTPLSTGQFTGSTAATAGARPPQSTLPTSTSLPTTGGVGGVGGAAGFIQADTANNALVITAPDNVYNSLRRVVDMLDTRRAQIHVEALIVELSSDLASEWGIQWQDFSGGRRSGAQLIGGTNFGSGTTNIIGLAQGVAAAAAGGTTGAAATAGNIFPPGLNVGVIAAKGQSGTPGLGVLARALETEAKANILSTPNLLTLDNEEARILIGQNVPLLTGAYAQTGAAATATPFQTYERRDVGLTLRIRPQISEGGVVRMQIFQETSSLQPNTLSNPSGPITNKRSIESAVLVDDGDIIVLGGLIEDNYGTGEDKIPLLGDIPFIGGLFRYQTRTRTKTNMMVFLRPQIIRDAAAYQGLTANRYDYILGEQRKLGENARLLPGEGQPPVLPTGQFAAPVVPAPAAPAAAAPAATAPAVAPPTPQ